MPDVLWKDREGFAWLVRVKSDTLPQNYGTGIVLGPPDLDDLDLPEAELKSLQEALVVARLTNAEMIKGSFSKLTNTVKNALPRRGASAKLLAHQIKAIYQQDYYQEEK